MHCCARLEGAEDFALVPAEIDEDYVEAEAGREPSVVFRAHVVRLGRTPMHVDFNLARSLRVGRTSSSRPSSPSRRYVTVSLPAASVDEGGYMAVMKRVISGKWGMCMFFRPLGAEGSTLRSMKVRSWGKPWGVRVAVVVMGAGRRDLMG